jgi:hypothetical protein
MWMTLFLSGTKSLVCTYYSKYRPRAQAAPLEQKFQPKLHQPRIRPSRRARHHPEILVICRAANRVGGRELGPIKYVEELRPEFQSQPFIAPKPRPLKDRKIKVADSLGP